MLFIILSSTLQSVILNLYSIIPFPNLPKAFIRQYIRPALTLKPATRLQNNWLHIIEGCKRNDITAQEQLYKHCYAGMMKVCLRYTAGDIEEAAGIYNKALLKVFKNINQYKGKGEFEGWIRKIIVNTCIDACRSKVKFQSVQLTDAAADVLPVIPEAYSRISANEIINLVNELPKNTALVFNLFVIEGYKHEEIGKMIGISAGTSKWHLNEARKLLKQKLETVLKKDQLANAI